MTEQASKKSKGTQASGEALPPVTSADIREKIEEMQRAAAHSATAGGAPKMIGALFGAAIALAVSYIAGRRSSR